MQLAAKLKLNKIRLICEKVIYPPTCALTYRMVHTTMQKILFKVSTHKISNILKKKYF